MLGISIREDIGIGDKLQFSSLPENYYRATGKKLLDVSRCWIFDYNPYVVREGVASKVIELWNFPKKYDWPLPLRCQAGSGVPHVYQTNAEIWANLLGVPAVLTRPRLYIHEEPIVQRSTILYHHQGKSHMELPFEVARHVMEKYPAWQIGLNQPWIPLARGHVLTPTIWELVSVISKCRMLIGVDSGPCWIAACYPDVVVKKIRNIKVHGERSYEEWIPLEIANIHSHWDDLSLFQVYHPWGDDSIGYMRSYREL